MQMDYLTAIFDDLTAIFDDLTVIFDDLHSENMTSMQMEHHHDVHRRARRMR